MTIIPQFLNYILKMLSSVIDFRMRQLIDVIVFLPVVCFSIKPTADDPSPQHDYRFVKIPPLGVASHNCSGSIPFSEEDFRNCFPAPPNFTVPPPPPFIASDCSTTYSWQLVKNDIAAKPERVADDCSKEKEEEVIQRVTIHQETPHSSKAQEAQPKTSRPTKDDNAAKKKDKNRVSSSKGNTTKTKREPLADRPAVDEVTPCGGDRKCKPQSERKKERRHRGVPGPPGPQGPPGPPGLKGVDGLSGLVVFADAAAMFGIAVEGLLAYRADVKQLFVRDHLTWRPIRVAKCGDGVVDRDLGEECDDGNDDIYDYCLGCRRSSCGDGVRNRRTEECDGRDFGDKTCATYRSGMTGPLTCTPECQISYRRCLHRRNLRR